ncbi:unnamed protein product [[Candida] boidinii]|uniref:Unnamed protein product n=1 Tax=Candida boidinii TaxID=5477 RepID=A0A9W6SY99_CANBO|nr:hypothetical protein B5S30_g4683 [[Candida] boidinii]OWB83063.1 hypothetical protein B5S33_g1692 [[Candida] boidinii]GME68554.1 unnamed protein product [[Candida] boidinii]GMF99612.1 unnamed protein product [[Candida] boidinii]
MNIEERDIYLLDSVLDAVVDDNCDIFYLDAGTLFRNLTGGSVNSTESVNIEDPVIYITNCSNTTDIYDYFDIPLVRDTLFNVSDIIQTRDLFVEGTISTTYSLCTICVVGWMLLTVQLLATNPKPKTLRLATMMFCVSITVPLVRFSSLMEDQYSGCYQDMDEVQINVYDSLAYTIPHVLNSITVWMSWGDVMNYMFETIIENKTIFTKKHRIIFNITLGAVMILNIVTTSFDHLHYPLNRNRPSILLTDISKIFIYTAMLIMVFYYSFIKRSFAYQLRTLPMVFLIYTFLIAPFALFLIWRRTSRQHPWAVVGYLISEILSVNLLWEWIYDIINYEKKHEVATVVGREIIGGDDSIMNGVVGRHGVGFNGVGGETGYIFNCDIGYNIGDDGVNGNQHIITLNSDSEYQDDISSNDDEFGDNTGINIGNDTSYLSDPYQYYGTRYNNIGEDNPNNSNIYEMDSLDSQQDDINLSSLNVNNVHGSHQQFYNGGTGGYHDDRIIEGTAADADVNDDDSPPDFEPHAGFQAGDYCPDEKRPQT